MRNIRHFSLIRQFSDIDLAVSLFFNRGCQFSFVGKFFAGVSRIGDGIFWYALMFALPVVYGTQALQTSLHMLLTAALGLIIYKAVKMGTSRRRPFAVEPRITLLTQPLDQYSFPSGHTLHAFSFSIVAMSYYPGLAWVLVPLTALIALSRLVLGLHYPSDVLAGALIGTLVSYWSVVYFESVQIF